MQHIHPNDFNEKVFPLINNDWMLITAGNSEECNTMTASYGSFGILFGEYVSHIYVRPERYTYTFLEENDTYSLSFFNSDYKDALVYCGRNSGKDHDKIKECGLTVLVTEDGTPYFKESRLTFICKKVFAQDLDKNLLLDDHLKEKVYGTGGHHRMYVGKILDIFYNE